MADDGESKPMNQEEMEDYGATASTEGAEETNAAETLQTNESADDDSGDSHIDKYTGCTVNEGCFFKDGKRQIDFVLVIDEDVEARAVREELGLDDGTEPGDAEKGEGVKSDQFTEDGEDETGNELAARIRSRRNFLNNLLKAGVEIEKEVRELKHDISLFSTRWPTTVDKTITYIKLHAPWEVLCSYAEDMCLRVPLEVDSSPHLNKSQRVMQMMSIPNVMENEVPNMPACFKTCLFRNSKIERFYESDDQENFFHRKDRIMIMSEILERTEYGDNDLAEVGIGRLLNASVFEAAYPLHDGAAESFQSKETAPNRAPNARQLLNEYWSSYRKWNKYQPLGHVREYFGEKIAIYFAWIGFYTTWLLPASIVGLLVFIYGLATVSSDTVIKDACDSGNTYKMCPLCDEAIGCHYWYLSEICSDLKESYLYDHGLTIVYAIFVALWAVTFKEFWKRKSACLIKHWDCGEFSEEEERPRATYLEGCSDTGENPITGKTERQFPRELQLPRVFYGSSFLILSVSVIIIFVVGIIIYRMIIIIPLFENDKTRGKAKFISSTTASFINLVIAMIIGRVYQKFAYQLTVWEMHRTEKEFENQLAIKSYIFEFMNCYAGALYIAFIKGKFTGYPGHYTDFFGLRLEECGGSGCAAELAANVFVVLVGKQILNNVIELVEPCLMAFFHRWNVGYGNEIKKSRWEEDYELLQPGTVFHEYLEMTLQFGFTTLFVVAFPLAPLFALLNNWFEIRLDAKKFICQTRRPVASRTEGIGCWMPVIEMACQLAVISNAFIVAFTSDFLPKLLYRNLYHSNMQGYVNFSLAHSPNNTLTQDCRYPDFRDSTGTRTTFFYQALAIRLLFVVVFEHIVFAIQKLIDICVPDVPESVEISMKRERYLAKRALADIESLDTAEKGKTEDGGSNETDEKVGGHSEVSIETAEGAKKEAEEAEESKEE